MSSHPFLHLYQVPLKYSEGYSSYRADTKSFSNKTKGDNSKSKKARVVNLVCDMPFLPDLHFYQVSSKYSKGYSSYSVEKSFTVHQWNPSPKQYVPPLLGGTGFCLGEGGGGRGDMIKQIHLLSENGHVHL